MSALKSFAASLLAVAGVIGGLDANQFTAVFPAGWGAWIVTAISVCAAVFHLFKGVEKTATPAAPAAGGDGAGSGGPAGA